MLRSLLPPQKPCPTCGLPIIGVPTITGDHVWWLLSECEVTYCDGVIVEFCGPTSPYVMPHTHELMGEQP